MNSEFRSFPAHALAPIQRQMAEAVAETVSIPPELPYCCVLAATSPKISVFRMRRDELPVRQGKFLENGATSVWFWRLKAQVCFRLAKVTKGF